MAVLRPGDRLRELLAERGMTQTGLARRLGWSQPAVGALISGSKTASLSRWQEVAEALGIDVQELFGPPTERVTVKVAGAELTGPASTISKVLAVVGLESPLAPDAAAVLRERRRPSPRHTGLHELLDLVDAGQVTLHPEDEVAIRTFGRSGPPVATLDEATELLRRLQSERTAPPGDEGPEPGVEASLSSPSLVAELGMTEEEQDALHRARCGGLVRTLQGAIRLLDAIRAGTGVV